MPRTSGSKKQCTYSNLIYNDQIFSDVRCKNRLSKKSKRFCTTHVCRTKDCTKQIGMIKKIGQNCYELEHCKKHICKHMECKNGNVNNNYCYLHK